MRILILVIDNTNALYNVVRATSRIKTYLPRHTKKESIGLKNIFSFVAFAIPK